MQNPTTDLSCKGSSVQIPDFLLDYTSDLMLFLELKSRLAEMFTEYVKSDIYKEGCCNTELTADIHYYLQSLIDSIYVAQSADVPLKSNNNLNRN